ncbi:hypothetical protein [Roseomonas sp. 18066]|uniref:hypothetical protein n=1 Tax=Roseomonas sp. 18066 TaxID=2681412 RepID=UPI00135C8A67|nr:hypothetical protein [Roseomonas sp. 18066]
MTFRLLLPLLLLGLGGCVAATPPAASPPAASSLLDRLPPEINGFTAFDPALALAPPAGMLLRPYQAADGPVIRVTLQPAADPAERAALATGAGAGPLRDRLDAEAAASFAFASALPQTIAERGPDFLVGRRGAGPLLRCIDIRLTRPEGEQVALLRNLTCAGSLEGQVVRMQMITRHDAGATAQAARVLAEFGGRAMESLLGLPPDPAAAPVAPHREETPPPRRADGLRRV